jgi:hypothetical protein
MYYEQMEEDFGRDHIVLLTMRSKAEEIEMDNIVFTFRQWGRDIRADYISKNEENAAKVNGSHCDKLHNALKDQSSALHKIKISLEKLNFDKLYHAFRDVHHDISFQSVQFSFFLEQLEGFEIVAESTHENTESLKRKADSLKSDNLERGGRGRG